MAQMTPPTLLGLTDDPAFRCARFLVIDFETTTPAGSRPEPIDVAAIVLGVRDGQFVETDRFSALIRPPDHAPITPADTDQTGITAAMVADQPDAAQVLARLDDRVAARLGEGALLVAHNAPTEAGLLYDYRRSCPHLAMTNLLDTVRLARLAYPDLPAHRLDVLIHHLRLRRPVDRHRAMPDVEITAEVFAQVLHDGHRDGRWATLRDLRRRGEYQAKATRPEQTSLF
jgi:DNA polymerase-3 subunit epsilon